MVDLEGRPRFRHVARNRLQADPRRQTGTGRKAQRLPSLPARAGRPRAVRANAGLWPGGAIDPDRLPPKDRLDHYRAERERLKLEAEQRLTLSATEVEAAVSKILKALAQQIETLPARLERDFGLTAAETARLYPAMDAARESLHAAAVEALRA
ncbi:MAG: DUF1441 family protein [Candidatus Competibacteraceae bacterium]|nr:DUF1441 family protein [Candidatus Competibacteraceae bacterium]MBK8896642.1 DUF1441 family protein [Candidatus Competibacteraceae bacterium]MBK8896750.1 DUF1441 family protein [Candidatus Competibacteraceae bacterium]